MSRKTPLLKQPETGGNTPIAILGTLLHETAFVGSDSLILDNPSLSSLAGNAHVMVRLGDYLTVYYFCFHQATNSK